MMGTNDVGARKSAKSSRMAAIEEEEDENVSEAENRSPNTSENRGRKASQSTYVLTKSNIARFGNYAMNFFLIPPRPTFLIGSLDKEIVIKHKIVRQKVEKNTNEMEAKRTKIKELEAGSKENETNNTVSETERIFRILKRAYKRGKGAYAYVF